MAWNIEFSPEARKRLSKIGSSEAIRILKFLHQRLRLLEKPRDLGKPLAGSTLSELWRYRVGNYRILCKIEDKEMCIMVIDVGHRSEIYN